MFTFCAHLLDKGWQEPRCVDVCPTGALTFGEEDELRDLIRKAEVLHPEFETKPRIYYIGLPKKFIAGALYDPKKDECIEGAKVIITNCQAGEQFVATTDDFGDFWVDGLETGPYFLVIEKYGYRPKETQSISTEND